MSLNQNQNYIGNKSIPIEKEKEDLGVLFETLSRKINNIELIDDIFITEIFDKLNHIQKNHNDKILNWYDKKFYQDLNDFKQNNDNFNNLIEFNKQNSFILINN